MCNNIGVVVISVTSWSWLLTFQPQNHIISRISERHSLYQVWTLWDHSFFSYTTDKQTDRQTNRRGEHPTHVARLCGVGNYTVSQKRSRLYSCHNFSKCWPISKILSLLYTARNLQQNYCYISYRTLIVSLHYRVKYKRSKIAKIWHI